jgi:hypothetical protein
MCSAYTGVALGLPISVLLPLQDERATGLKSFRAWTEQTAPAGAFEIVALAPGENRRLERETRELLRPQDQWIAMPGAGEYELFNAGAEEAQGEFVFLTEAHCLPEPDCLAKMLAELDRPGTPGVRGASVSEADGALAELERDAFDGAIRVEEDPEHWRKVLIHSTAVRRDLYLQCGGLPPRYGDFAPWVLAIALRERGARLRYSPLPRVHHIYDGDIAGVGVYVRNFGRGEMLYRSETRAELTEPYLVWATEWEQRLEYTRPGARRAVRAAVALRHTGAAAPALRHATVAAFGPRPAMVRARIGAFVARHRARLGRDPGRRRGDFDRFWWLRSRLGRLEGLVAADGGPPVTSAPAARIDLTGPCSGSIIGFYDPEQIESGESLRWSSALALLQVNVPGSGASRARLELHPLERPAKRPARVKVSVDDRVVAAEASDEAIEFEIDGGEHWIAIACAPLRPHRHGVDDHRALGVPVRSLTFTPSTGREGGTVTAWDVEPGWRPALWSGSSSASSSAP